MKFTEDKQSEEIKKAQIKADLIDFVNTDLAKAIVMLRALGITSGEITSIFSLSQEAQEYIIGEIPHLTKLFDSYDVSTRETDNERMLRMARQALALKGRILEDESQPMSLRNNIATEIYEQVYGKARQKIETVNYNIDAGENIDKLKAGLETIYTRLVETAQRKGLIKDEALNRDAIEA